jgi:hypothetical protein
MNAISHNFLDANGQIDFARWDAHLADQALGFRDKDMRAFMDAQVGYAFLTPQLHRIEAEVYQQKYPSFDFGSLMFVDTSGDMWDVGTIFYSMDQAGRAEFISGKGFDMPYADALMNQHSHGFHLAGIGYEYTIQELERAAKLGRTLTADKAMAADRAAQIFLYNVALTGRTPGAATSEKNWTGLINNASVPAANVPADGTGSSRLWSAKTPDQIARDFWEAVNAVETATGETHRTNTVLLPTSRYRYLQATRMSDTGTTIMAYILAAQDEGERITVRPSRALETAGASSTARMVAYDNSREVVRFHLPGPHEFLDPFQKSSMTYEIAGIMNVGGTENRLPKAMAYRDGI